MSSALVSILLLSCAAGLMIWHVCSWQAAQQEPLDAEELDFRQRQFRRRMKTSATLAVLAIVLFAGEWLMLRFHWRLMGLFYWVGVLLVLLWISLMAVIDVLATQFHFARRRQNYLVEQAKLRTELRRLQASGNGREGEGLVIRDWGLEKPPGCVGGDGGMTKPQLPND